MISYKNKIKKNYTLILYMMAQNTFVFYLFFEICKNIIFKYILVININNSNEYKILFLLSHL